MTDTDATPLLFTPFRLRQLETRNRVVISPMCQYSARDGLASDWHMVHLGQFAMGGAGIVFTEAAAVEERGRITHGDLGIWREDQARAIRSVVDFIKAHGAVPAIQLAHAGRKGSARPPWQAAVALDATDAAENRPPWETVAPSAFAFEPTAAMPRALAADEMPALITAWRTAAARARDVGFEAVEVHAAHGYLIHQFLSSLSNRRNDAWGGDLARRMRLLLEIVEAVRAEWPTDRPMFVRLSVADEADPEWTLADVLTLVGELSARGVDVIDCSSGGIGKSGYAIRGRHIVGYQIGLAEQVRRASRMTCMAVGLITNGRQAEDVLRAGQADLVAVGREALVDPFWARHAAADLGFDDSFKTWPRQYGWWLDKRAQSMRRVGA